MNSTGPSQLQTSTPSSWTYLRVGNWPKPCENEVDVAAAFCGAGHLCGSPPGSHAPLAPTSAPSDPRPVEDILAVCGGGTDRLVMVSPSAADDGGFVSNLHRINPGGGTGATPV